MKANVSLSFLLTVFVYRTELLLYIPLSQNKENIVEYPSYCYFSQFNITK